MINSIFIVWHSADGAAVGIHGQQRAFTPSSLQLSPPQLSLSPTNNEAAGTCAVPRGNSTNNPFRVIRAPRQRCYAAVWFAKFAVVFVRAQMYSLETSRFYAERNIGMRQSWGRARNQTRVQRTNGIGVQQGWWKGYRKRKVLPPPPCSSSSPGNRNPY